MINDKKTRTVEEEGVIATAAYRIDESAIGHITSILSNMYSDPPLAVVREYFSNAVDAHTAAGCPDTPVSIKFPTKLDPTFVLRDRGRGLSLDATTQYLGGYGATGDEKRTSNDMIGGFGIGAKVGFAVSSAFNYTIYHGGRKRVWSCYLDEHDRGRMSLLHDEVSDEHTGIEITIPVAESWIPGFQAAADKAFLFSRVKPTITGIPKGHVSQVNITPAVGSYDLKLNIDGVDSVIRVMLLSDVFTRSDSSPQAHGDDDHYRVVVGNAGYAVDLSKLGMSPSNTSAAQVLLSNIRIEAPIGFLQVAPSREALQYSQRTIKVLRSLLEALLTPRIGLHMAESVVGVTAAKAELPGLGMLSIGLDRLYGAGQSKVVVANADKRYLDWIEASPKHGITATLPTASLQKLTTQAPATKCEPYAFRLRQLDKLNSDVRWAVERIPVAVALASGHKMLNANECILGAILPSSASEYTDYQSAASLLVAKHLAARKTGYQARTMYVIAWFIEPAIHVQPADLDALLESSPYCTEDVVTPIKHALTPGLISEGKTALSGGYYGPYQLSSELNEPYRRHSRGRTSWNAGTGNGAQKVAAHSRKFVVPSSNPNSNSDKASDLWEAALASDVKNNGLVYIPLDEFRVATPDGIQMLHRDIRPNATFLSQISHQDIVDLFDRLIVDCKLVGVRVGEVESLKANSNYINFWTACQNVFSEAVKEQEFADALLVRLSLDSDDGHTYALLALQRFIVTQNIRVPWYADAVRWAKAFSRAEAYLDADAGLFRLATACFKLCRHSPMWETGQAGVRSKILGTVKGTCLATINSAFECSQDYRAADTNSHVLIVLWQKILDAYPMIPYMIPAMADECGHWSPFGGRVRRGNSISDSHVFAVRQCLVTFNEHSIGEEYLEQYLRVMPPLTKDLEVARKSKKQKP